MTKLQIISKLWSIIFDLLLIIKGESDKTLEQIENGRIPLPEICRSGRYGGANMRGLKRQKQVVYWSRAVESLDGIDTVTTYQKPEKHLLSVSATAGTPEELSAGYIPDYDRYITCFDRTFQPQVADVFWIDRVPELDENGFPTVYPDYRLKKILDTQKGNIARYGIKYIGDGSDGE